MFFHIFHLFFISVDSQDFPQIVYQSFKSLVFYIYSTLYIYRYFSMIIVFIFKCLLDSSSYLFFPHNVYSFHMIFKIILNIKHPSGFLCD